MALNSVMNDTKWNELRHAMYALGHPWPRWRTRDTENGHVSDWDGEWYYHFNEGGYSTIEWVEIQSNSNDQLELILARLRAIHVPGEPSPHGFIVYGYTQPGQVVDYL